MLIFSPHEMKYNWYLPKKVNFLFILYSTEIQKAQPNFFLGYKRGVCRPLEEESSFCLGLSTRPVSEIVPVCLNPRFFSSHYFVVMRFLEK